MIIRIWLSYPASVRNEKEEGSIYIRDYPAGNIYKILPQA
jgi:hypothetical protein